MENKMTVSANYAMRAIHLVPVVIPHNHFLASNMHRASIPSASSKQQTSCIVSLSSHKQLFSKAVHPAKNRNLLHGVDL